MENTNINPVSVGTAFLDILMAEFPQMDKEATPTTEEILIAELLYVKFAKTTNDYTFIDEYENALGESF